MLEILVLFARKPSKNKGLSEESRKCCALTARYLYRHPLAKAIMARQAADFSENYPYGHLMKVLFSHKGVPDRQVNMIDAEFSTLGEITAAENYLQYVAGPVSVRAVSAWYHLPRIWCLWRFKYGRSVKLQPYWSWDLKWALLELPKFAFVLFPVQIQNVLGERLRKWGLM